MYYADKLQTLRDLFGSHPVRLDAGRLVVEDRVYPIIDDVVILLDASQYPPALRRRLEMVESRPATPPSEFASDIQFTFGEEWQRFPKILPEHAEEFRQYFDLVSWSDLKNARVCDLGCGIGRWSYFLQDKCRELVLIDFSEAIFVARRNLASAPHALFFMGDLRKLPFRRPFADFLFSLGVLHHLPTPALDEVRALRKYAPRLLIYLYYALDNRPLYFRALLAAVTGLRLVAARIRSAFFRDLFTWVGAVGLYLPLVLLGALLRPLGWSRYVPLYDTYRGKGLKRIRQDVYDRFFTRIEQRVSRKDILALQDTFPHVVVSDQLPYWHFLCQSDP